MMIMKKGWTRLLRTIKKIGEHIIRVASKKWMRAGADDPLDEPFFLILVLSSVEKGTSISAKNCKFPLSRKQHSNYPELMRKGFHD